jgi:hypothetical protein
MGGFDVLYHQYIFHENTIWGMLLSYGEMDHDGLSDMSVLLIGYVRYILKSYSI